MVRPFAAAWLLLASVLFPQPFAPAVARRGDALEVRLPSGVLHHRDVRRQLDTALTTTFVIETKVRDGASVLTRMEVRYDLWDEVFHAKRIGEDDKAELARLKSLQELELWWRAPILVPRAATAATVDVAIVVLPFSAAEASDARQWLSRSGGLTGGSPERKGIIDALIGTSLSARPVGSFRWSVKVPSR